MGLQIEPVDDAVQLITLDDMILKVLQKSKIPLNTKQIIELTGVEQLKEDDIEISIELLERKGYDVKEIVGEDENLYVLVRFFDYVGNGSEKYRTFANIKPPILATSDWHYGSVGFQRDAHSLMMDDCDDYGIKHVMVAGDLIQGRKVFKTELQELAIPKITKQVSGLINLLKQVPCKTHIVSGNHEEKLKGDVEVGYDALAVAAMAVKKVSYYGHVGMFKLNRNFKYMMMHGSGAVTQASTQMIEKIWRELVERPNILHCGHTHQLCDVIKGQSQYAMISGTIQRTSAWLLSKGYNSKIGWTIINDFDGEKIELIKKTPVVK